MNTIIFLWDAPFAKISLLDGNLNMNVRGGLNRIKSKSDTYDHTLHNWFMNAKIDYKWKKWNSFWSITTRRNNLSGETITYSDKSTTIPQKRSFIVAGKLLELKNTLVKNTYHIFDQSIST